MLPVALSGFYEVACGVIKCVESVDVYDFACGVIRRL